MSRFLSVVLCVGAVFVTCGCEKEVEELPQADNAPEMSQKEKDELMQGEAKHQKTDAKGVKKAKKPAILR